MKTVRNEIKISFKEPKFTVDSRKREVRCTLSYSVKAPNDDFFPMYGDCVHSFAKCTKNDKFDKEYGKRIALARAENKAYCKVARGFDSIYKDLDYCLNTIDNFQEKALKCVKHNAEYLAKLTK